MSKADLTTSLPIKRVLFLDVMRLIATVAVVLIHVCAPVVGLYGQISVSGWWLGNTLDTLSRWAVPGFVMIAGAILLDVPSTETTPSEIKTFYHKRIKRLLVPLLFWSTFFAIYYHFFRGDPLSVFYVLRRIVFDQPFEHLYFLWLLLELAIVTPLFREVVKRVSFKTLGVLLLFLLGLTLIWTPHRFLPIFFIPYLSYYVAGVYFKRVVLDKKMIALAAMTTAGALTTIGFGTWLAFSGALTFRHPLVLYEYTNAPVLFLSLGVFVLIRWICELETVRERLNQHSSLLFFLSKITFGIYLLHLVVIDVLIHGAGITVLSFGNVGVGVAVQLLLTLILTGALSYGVELVSARFLRQTKKKLE